jgi:chitinase
LTRLIEKCHGVGTKVYISVGGYSDRAGTRLARVFEKIAAADGLRAAFADNIEAVVLQYGFDGVEIDWEYPLSKTGADYEKTVLLLSEKMKSFSIPFAKRR